MPTALDAFNRAWWCCKELASTLGRTFALVIIHDLNIVCVPLEPAKAYSPTIGYPNAVLPFSDSFELFQPVSRRNPQVFQRFRCIENQELAVCSPVDRGRKPPQRLALEDLSRFFASKALDHDLK